jgi:hypothetical protein
MESVWRAGVWPKIAAIALVLGGALGPPLAIAHKPDPIPQGDGCGADYEPRTTVAPERLGEVLKSLVEGRPPGPGTYYEWIQWFVKQLEALDIRIVADILSSRGMSAKRWNGALTAAVSKLVLSHPAGFEERSMALRNLVEHLRFRFRFYDQLMGIPTLEAELEEKQPPASAGFTDEQVALLGIRAEHDLWFSQFETLARVAGVIQDLGVKSVADLGCGTGRLALFLAFMGVEAQFTGIDLVEPRLNAARTAARRWGLEGRMRFERADLLDESVPLPKAEFYYIFGPTNDPAVNQEVIWRIANSKPTEGVWILSQHDITKELLRKQVWLRQRPVAGAKKEALFVGEPPVEP